MPSTLTDLDQLVPSDVARDIASAMEEFHNADYFDTECGLSYTAHGLSYAAGDFVGVPGGFVMYLVAVADDESKCAFRIHIEPVA